jgi:predicted small secreted protein
MKIVKATVAILTFGLLAACNTIQGVGKDVNAVGKAIEKSAD